MATLPPNVRSDDEFAVPPKRSVNQTSEDAEESPTPSSGPQQGASPGDPQRLHRIREIRLKQGVSLRTAARHTGVDVRSLRAQEKPQSDLRISDLLKWQAALDVPLIELLEETDEPLSRPVMERARLIRLMKTVVAMREQSGEPGIQRMAQMLMDQLIEVMPELAEVSPWHTYGKRRGMEEMGRIYDAQIRDDGVSSCE